MWIYTVVINICTYDEMLLWYNGCISIRSALFSSLLEDIVALERRGIELQEFYAKKINAEEHYEVTCVCVCVFVLVLVLVFVCYQAVCTYVCMYVCVYVCMYVCTYVCMYVCVCMYL